MPPNNAKPISRHYAGNVLKSNACPDHYLRRAKGEGYHMEK
jgi:hypothetical protein